MSEELSGNEDRDGGSNDCRSFDYFQSLANHPDWECKEKRKDLLKGIIHLSFPQRLFLLLNHDDNGSVAWCEEDPRAFRILDKDRLMVETIPHFFQMSNFRSFLRQLNNYGFARCRDQKMIRYQFSHPQFCRWDIRSVQSLQRREPGSRRRSYVSSPTYSEDTMMAEMSSSANEPKVRKDPSEFEFDPLTVFERNSETFVYTVED
eukprot:gene16106-18191_t